MKQGILWLSVCFACLYLGIPADNGFGFFVVGFPFLVWIVKQRKIRRNLERRNQNGPGDDLWDMFSKEFTSSLAKAAASLLMALIGVLLLRGTGDAATPAAIGLSLGTMILSGFGGF